MRVLRVLCWFGSHKVTWSGYPNPMRHRPGEPYSVYLGKCERCGSPRIWKGDRKRAATPEEQVEHRRLRKDFAP